MAKIGLDFGHGVDTFPPDKGVYKGGKGYAEHSFNAKLGMRIKELLEANGHTVILGQQPNKKDVPLTMRTNLYNSKKVDIVVSLHANAGKSDVEGRCVFYWGTSSKGKKLAELIRDEIRNAGYSLHGNGLHAGKIGEWTNLHITRETNMPAVLIEHGFMTNKNDFELIFGNKQDKYIEDMAQADVKGIQRYLGQDYKDVKPSAPKPSKPKPSKGKSVSQMADEVIAGKHGSGHANRRKSLGISQAEYNKVRAEVNRRAGSTNKPAPKKSIAQMVNEVLKGKHGNGHAQRQKSLGISKSEYNKVKSEVNKRLMGAKPSSKSISQMATEVIAGKHGSGHENRRKSLGISKTEYEKVRAEVNKRL